jgi:hypothetical protein
LSSSDDDSRHEEIVLAFIEDFGLLMGGFGEDIGELNQAIMRLKTEAEHHHEIIKTLDRLVVDGNGQPPLLSRIAVLEAKTEQVAEKQRQWWELFMVALPGIISLIATGTIIM